MASSKHTISPLKPPPLPTSPAPNAHIAAPHSPLTILFTDIESSSHLWDTDPRAMAIAMKAHDRLLRQYMALYRGYEVKQNGDGFMIAFQGTKEALEFCLGVRGALPGHMADHDRERSEHDTNDEDMTDGRRGNGARSEWRQADKRFRNIKLRMALHYGDVYEQGNPVTGRADYMGPLVNRAARYIQATEPGWIVVSEAFLRSLRDGWKKGGSDANGSDAFGDGEVGDSFEIKKLGEMEFKGVEGKEKLFLVLSTVALDESRETGMDVPEGDVVGWGSVGGELRIEEGTF